MAQVSMFSEETNRFSGNRYLNFQMNRETDSYCSICITDKDNGENCTNSCTFSVIVAKKAHFLQKPIYPLNTSIE